MRYRVRTQDGELEFASLYDIERAYAQGLVDEDDELQEDGSDVWRKIAAIPAIRQARPAREPSGDKRLLEIATVLCGALALYELFFGQGLQLPGLHLPKWLVVLVLALITSSLGWWVAVRAFRKKP